jgi:hypothetical protein
MSTATTPTLDLDAMRTLIHQLRAATTCHTPRRPATDLTGRIYGMLLVTGTVEKRGKGHHWLCECECGNSTWIRTDNLTGGRSRSCGCQRFGHNRPTISAPRTSTHNTTGKEHQP